MIAEPPFVAGAVNTFVIVNGELSGSAILSVNVGAGGSTGSLDASNIIKPALARGEIRCIGATTFEIMIKIFFGANTKKRRIKLSYN